MTDVIGPEDGFGKPFEVRDFVLANARRGDPGNVLSTLDHYAVTHRFLMNVGPEKGRILTAAVDRLGPGARVVEFGTYCGYSALLITLHLDVTAHLISVDVDPDSIAAARDIVEFAGFGDRVELIEGASHDVIPTLTGPFDFVFLDHWKDVYEPDLKALENHGLLRPGSVVFADNVGPHFEADSYLDYVRTCGKYDSSYHESTIEYTTLPDGAEISLLRP
jgi:catechol O-methyltransferase